MIWKLIAKFCAKPAVANWLIARAMKTPYSHIEKDEGTYMERYWLFNPYFKGAGLRRWGDWLPSFRIHWIRLPDRDRHMHDHPWECRTIILKGGYTEKRMAQPFARYGVIDMQHIRTPGNTATLNLGEFHAIESITVGGVWTLFITWKYQGTWGFLVDGKKVPYKKYLGLD